MKRIDNPPNPWATEHHEWLEPPGEALLDIYEERSRSILSSNDSPDIGFRWSVNPYRGCQHACSYCYARRTHEYLDLGAGTDFETKIVVKPDAPRLLDKAFRARKWQGELVVFSGVTDCYQPIEAVYRLTRQCLEVCIAHRNPAAIVTKSFLVVRDIDVLIQLRDVADAAVMISIAFAGADLARKMDPGASTPDRRFEAMRRLADAGVPVGVMVAPIIPGLNDADVPKILARAADSGASTAAYTVLRLPGSVEPVFLSRLKATLPLRYERVVNHLREMRGGRLNDSRFLHRMKAEGNYWTGIKTLFEVSARRVGLRRPGGMSIQRPTSMKPQETHQQLTLPFAD